MDSEVFVDLLRSIYKDLMLWYNFGVDRSRFSDYYKDNMYMYPVSTTEGSIGDPFYYFEECTSCSEEDEDRDLETIGRKLYWVYKVSDNIYRDREVFDSFLCCYNFTDAVKGLLTYSMGHPRVLLEDRGLAGYNYESSLPVDRESSLLPHFSLDGVYIAQYKFDSEDHAFILVKDGDDVTVVNFYDAELYSNRLSYYEVMGMLYLVEQNDRDNKPILKTLLGPDLYFNSPYHVISLVDCYYWSKGVRLVDYKRYLRDVVLPLFEGRREERVIKILSR